MNRTDLDSNRAFRSAVAAVIAAAALNGTAGATQALADAEGPADAIAGTAEATDARTGPVETAPVSTAPANTITATTPAGTMTAATQANTINATTPANTITTATALAPEADTTSTASAAGTPGRPIWTRTGLAEVVPGLTRPANAKATARKARKAKAARRTPLRVHRRVWRTSARPNVRVWAPRTPKGRNKAIAYRLVTQRSWPVTQFRCLDSLWTRESNWNHRAQNPSSGAYGIPQALPGHKMVGVGHDWRVNPATQIRWGLKYIKGRYGSPCGAWGHFRSHNWY